MSKRDQLSDRILFDWLYPVCMFQAWVTEKHQRKLVRFLGIVCAFPWMIVFLPLLFLGALVCLPLMVWEDS